jgi:FMN-dependent NADH-azoreductase
MSDILFINACVRENSRTLSLAKHVLLSLGGKAEEVKLYEADLAPLDAEGMKARDEASRSKDFSDSRFDLARQFASAETIVIAAPYWDLSFPAILKTYFEAVTVNGLTFTYSDKGFPIGLCKAERLVYVTTSGGPMVSNLGFDYASALAKTLYGIKDVRCVFAEGLDIRGADVDAILLRAKGSVKQILS